MSPAFSPDRRRFLQRTGLAGVATLLGVNGRAEDSVQMPFANGERRLVQFPEKRPLILVTHRPPQLETPFAVFDENVLTPNDAFFVRYHLANIPLSVDPAAFRLEVKGLVKVPLNLSLDELRTGFENVETVAVNQCSGNGRAFFQPRVGGGQLGNGAMGNARWRGVRLKEVLEKAGVQAGALQVVANGLDAPVLEKTPDFIKSLGIDHALDGEVLLAWEMNGAPLPMLNGFPLRLVVPGYYGTYWVKHLNELTVVGEPFAGFWMSSAYRIPATPGAAVEPGTVPKVTVPITRYNVRSFITSHQAGTLLRAARATLIKGIAFDGGQGIREVLFSSDAGASWKPATLGPDLGRYSFRPWSISFSPERPGEYALQCRAFNGIGESQPLEPLWNPAGYMRNVVETVPVTVRRDS